MKKQNTKQIAADFCINHCIQKNLEPVSKAHLKQMARYLELCFKHAAATMSNFYPKLKTKGKK